MATAIHEPRAADQVRPPSALLALTELPRAIAELGSLAAAAGPLLAAAPRGDGHPVLVLPGFMTSDVSTGVLRRFLTRLGYDARTWDLGRNLGPRAIGREGEHLVAKLRRIHEETGQTVSLVGWSLGGVYAREMARRHPRKVRQVITLGSPYALRDPRQTYAHGPYQRLSSRHAPDRRLPSREQQSRPIDVPSTSVYSRWDGVVAWQACVEPETALHQNVEVRCSHVGFGVDPATPGGLAVLAYRVVAPGAARAAVAVGVDRAEAGRGERGEHHRVRTD